MKRPLAIALILALAALLLLVGCGKKNPVKVEPEKPYVYPDQSTPEKTLLRMAAAFARRDSVMTDSVYADNYEGTSTDMVPIPTTYTFTKLDEISVVAALARSSAITFVNVDFKPPATWFKTHYVSDPPELITIQIPSFQVDVYGGFDGFTARSPAAGETWIFEFTLRGTPDVSSPTDTTWTIVKWVEVRDHF